MKHDYRIVARNTLADLETQVRLKEKEGWVLVLQEGAPSLVEVLNMISGVGGLAGMATVPMKRAQGDE